MKFLCYLFLIPSYLCLIKESFIIRLKSPLFHSPSRHGTETVFEDHFSTFASKYKLLPLDITATFEHLESINVIIARFEANNRTFFVDTSHSLSLHLKSHTSVADVSLALRSQISTVNKSFVPFGAEIKPRVNFWHHNRLDLTPEDGTYTSQFNGTGKIIYIIDTGVNKEAVDLRNADIVNIFVLPSLSEGFFGMENIDDNGHGTHIAGIIVGQFSGAASGVSIRSIKVIGREGFASTADILTGINVMRGNMMATGVLNAILLLAFSSPCSDGSCIHDVICEGLAMVPNVITIAAGGNYHNCSSCLVSPGACPSVISVGSTKMRSNSLNAENIDDDIVSEFSNQYECQSLFAPGEAVWSSCISSVDLAATGDINGLILSTLPDCFSVSKENDAPSFRVNSGTSMAAALTAAVAAQVLELDGGLNSITMTNALQVLAAKDRISDLGSTTKNLLLQSPQSSSDNIYADRGATCPSSCSGHGYCPFENASACLCDSGYTNDACDTMLDYANCSSSFAAQIRIFDESGDGWRRSKAFLTSVSTGAMLEMTLSCGYGDVFELCLDPGTYVLKMKSSADSEVLQASMQVYPCQSTILKYWWDFISIEFTVNQSLACTDVVVKNGTGMTDLMNMYLICIVLFLIML